MVISKDCHRFNICLTLHNLTLSCNKGWCVKDNAIYITLLKSGKELCRSEDVTGYKITSKDHLHYSLTWRDIQLLEFDVKLCKNKITGIYDRESKNIKICVNRGPGDVHCLASANIEVAEFANKQTDENMKQIKLKCKSNKITQCDVLATFSLTEGTCTIDDVRSENTTNSITDNNSIISSGTCDVQSGYLSESLNILLSKVEFVGLESTEWEKMQIIFVVFGILPDPMIHLQDLVKQMKQISPYVEVVHICQGPLDHEAALWPYLPVQDQYNAEFHELFAITPEHAEHPRPYVCVVNNRLTEYYIINDSDVGRYVEDNNVKYLYNLWCYKDPPIRDNNISCLSPIRSFSMHEVGQIPRITAIQRPKSNSMADLSPLINGQTNGHLVIPQGRVNKVSKTRNILESKEYKKIEEELHKKCEVNNQLKEQLIKLRNEMSERDAAVEELKEELSRVKEKVFATEYCLLECQQENIFYRHQLLLRGNLYLRSGTFKMFRKRWFELEPGYIISFYNGTEKLGSIPISDMTDVTRVSDVEFKISTQFTEYMLSSDTSGDTSTWLVGLETLRHLMYNDM